MKYFTDNDLDKLVHFQVPKVLIIGDNYKSMKPNTKMLYIVLLDRMKLSMQNGWKDEGKYYVRMSAQKAAELLGFSESTFKRAKKELQKLNLLDEKQEGLTKTNKLFIGQLEYTDEDIYKLNNEVDDIMTEAEEHAQTVDKSLKGQNELSRSVKMTRHEVSKRTTNNNNIIKNDLSKNELLINKQEPINKFLTPTEFKIELTNSCNDFYSEFAFCRWNKKSWIVLIESFVNETIEQGRYINVPADKIQGYAYQSLKNMAYKFDLKNGKIEHNIPFYNFLEE